MLTDVYLCKLILFLIQILITNHVQPPFDLILDSLYCLYTFRCFYFFLFVGVLFILLWLAFIIHQYLYCARYLHWSTIIEMQTMYISACTTIILVSHVHWPVAIPFSTDIPCEYLLFQLQYWVCYEGLYELSNTRSAYCLGLSIMTNWAVLVYGIAWSIVVTVYIIL